MRAVGVVVILALWASVTSAGEIVVLSTGERMDVESYEIQRNVVVIKTWDGRHRTLPLMYVDVAATEAANDQAELADRIAPDRLAKARRACDAYGVLSAVALYRDALDGQIQKYRGDMPIATFDRLRAAFRNAFDDERSFEAVVAHFAQNANHEMLDGWNEWLATPFAQRMVAMENATLEGGSLTEARRYFVNLSKDRNAYARRRGMIERLDAARRSTESGVEVVLYLMESFFEAGRQIYPDETIEYNPDELRRTLTPSFRRSNLDGMLVLFRDATDEELERYIAYWTTAEGKRISDLLNQALEAGAMEGSKIALEILAGRRQTVP